MTTGDKKEQVPYSQLRQQKRQPLSEIIPLKGPFTIYLEPTNICNFKCVFCPESFSDYEEKSGGLHQMSYEDFVHIADQIKRMGTVKTLNFYMMGEPFVNKQLIQFIAYAKQQNIAERVIVTTNGSLLTESKYNDIIHSGLDYLRVSIYGASDDTHKGH